MNEENVLQRYKPSEEVRKDSAELKAQPNALSSIFQGWIELSRH